MASRNSNLTRLPYDATSESRHRRSPATASFPSNSNPPRSQPAFQEQSVSNNDFQLPTGSYGTSLAPRSNLSVSISGDAMSGAPGPVDEHGVPITYTPITHRVSKAKKGKKVFTRAEHRKRHEANHRTEPLFKCQVEDCQKPFQRIDLLTRHLERQHGIIQEMPQEVRRRRRSMTSSAGHSKAGSPAPSSVTQERHPSGMEHSMIKVTPESADSMSVGPIVDASMPEAYPSLSSWTAPFTFPGSSEAGSFTQEYPFDTSSAAEPSPMYSSDGWNSPGSEHHHFHLQKQSYLSTYHKPIVSYASDIQSQPASAPMAAAGIWTSSEGYLYPNEGLGIEFAGHDQTPVAAQLPPILPSNVDSAYVANDAPERPLNSNATSGALVSVDSETLQHYDDCFWEHFDPLFPILHHPTFMPANNPSLLGALVLAVGSQFSSRPNAPSHSAAWFAFASRQCAAIELDSISGETLLATLQGIFLFEYLALYRSRSAGVHISRQFSTMLNSLYSLQIQHASDPAIYAASLPPNPTLNDLDIVHGKWVEMESRNRLLLASLILDTQRKMLFDQEAAQPIDSAGSFLPTPCHANAWATTDFDQWHTLVSTPADVSASPTRFQLAIATVLNFADSPSPLYSSLASYPDPFLQLARYAPVSSLIITAACSWLFARKVTLESWTASKDYLRSWTASSDAAIATWWAGKILRTYFAKQALPPNTRPLPNGLEEDWCLYLSALVIWAFTYPNLPPTSAARVPSLSSAGKERIPVLRRSETQPRPGAVPVQLPKADTNTLQLPSRSYSYGRRTSSGSSSTSLSASPIPRSISPVHVATVPTRRGSPFHVAASSAAAPYTAMQAFLTRLDTDSWQEVIHVRGAGGVEGVLVGVRGALARGGGTTGEKGALIGEAGRVLERLVEGRGMIW